MEVEYIALSNALRDVIPMVNLLKEMKEYGIEHEGNQPTIHCKVFEDNSSALTLATKHQWHPRTKHINSIQYHHFRSAVNDGSVKIYPIESTAQLAEMLTKPLASELLLKHRSFLMGW